MNQNDPFDRDRNTIDIGDGSAPLRTALNGATDRELDSGKWVSQDRIEALDDAHDSGTNTEIPAEFRDTAVAVLEEFESQKAESEGEATIFDPNGEDTYLEKTREGLRRLDGEEDITPRSPRDFVTSWGGVKKFRDGPQADQLEDVHETRPKNARRPDERQFAPLTLDVEKWREHPDEYDYPGVDTPDPFGIHEKRPEKAREMDEDEKAPLAPTVAAWAESPGRFDLPGVDLPTDADVPEDYEARLTVKDIFPSGGGRNE